MSLPSQVCCGRRRYSGADKGSGAGLGDHPRRRSPLRLGPAGIMFTKPAPILLTEGSTKCQSQPAPAANDGSRRTEAATNHVSIGSLPREHACSLWRREQPMAPAMMNGTSGSAPASSTTPIKISTAIAIKNTNTGLIRAAAATTENLAQVRNWPTVGRLHRADACHTGHVMVNKWCIDVLFLSVKHSKPNELADADS
jgi:hypothetical protein